MICTQQSKVNTAAHARSGDIAGVMLTKSVSILGNSHEAVFDTDASDVRISLLSLLTIVIAPYAASLP